MSLDATKVGAAVDFSTIRAVLFDLDGTLYRQTRLRALMAAELVMLPLHGPFKALRRLRALQAYRRSQEALRCRQTVVRIETQVTAAAADSGLPVAEVEGLIDEWIMRRPLKYLQFCRAHGLDEMLGSTGRAGLRVGLLSDYPAEAKLEAMGLRGRFAPVLCASDEGIGAFKPSPIGFLRACEIWGIPPAEVLFVGDRPEVDAVGAAAAGMPCAIIGRTPGPPEAAYAVFDSLERLSRVIDSRR